MHKGYHPCRYNIPVMDTTSVPETAIQYQHDLFQGSKSTTTHKLQEVDITKDEMERALGFVPTPPEVVSFMTDLTDPKPGKKLDVLEPACADCRFLTAFREGYGSHHCFYGVEINPDTVQLFGSKVPFVQLLEVDFLLWNSDQRYDLIIGNPPYGIIGDASHYPIHVLQERKVAYKQRCRTWKGKYNIYGAFIESALRLLKPDGKLIFVVPATWLVLDDFSLLRQHLASSGKLSVYYLGKAFPGRNVIAVVLKLERDGRGLDIYEGTTLKMSKSDYRGEIIRFENPETVAFEQSGIPLEQLFSIHFAARSPEIRKSPFVVFKPQSEAVPVLTGRNLHANYIDYENCYSGMWMPIEKAPLLRSFYGFPHIVVAHTKGSRVVAALDARCYPWREEFHLVSKREGIDIQGVVDYLNEAVVQQNVQTLYRDFVPHLTRTMLQRVPIPKILIRRKETLSLPIFDEDVTGDVTGDVYESS
jgi:adenine-specific DNA-methyltransferase